MRETVEIMRYPVTLTPAPEGGYMVSFVDIPEALTQGETVAEAMEAAKDALLTAFDFYFEDNELIYYQTALAYEANDEVDKAVSNLLKSISVNEKFPLGYKRLGMLFMARGENEDAKEYFNEYLGFDIPLEEKEKIQKIIDRLG